ncbi:hypothetical protein J2Z69_003471 [Paenibacillus shirakamiensis]|uniref:Uncharacterized protein n=1 Tax=Paenibacillus shirakamiensis TaxID=1265935 RepID=A0ABS4JL33_9BACL|nr:hypothetical protein [Paenibacillus shirakamiensis]
MALITFSISYFLSQRKEYEGVRSSVEVDILKEEEG